VETLQQQLQTQDAPTAQSAAAVLLVLGKRADLMEIGPQEREAIADLLSAVTVLLNDRSEQVVQATSHANNLHPLWKMEVRVCTFFAEVLK